MPVGLPETRLGDLTEIASGARLRVQPQLDGLGRGELVGDRIGRRILDLSGAPDQSGSKLEEPGPPTDVAWHFKNAVKHCETDGPGEWRESPRRWTLGGAMIGFRPRLASEAVGRKGTLPY